MKNIFDETRINSMVLKNRMVRSATWENMADENGHMTGKLFKVYGELARGGVGMIISGCTFVMPGDQVYAGQVVGQHIRDEDLVINVCRAKHLTGHRAVPTAIVEALSTPRLMSLDESIEYLSSDELLEVTPDSLRIRKKELKHEKRQKAAKKAKKK